MVIYSLFYELSKQSDPIPKCTVDECTRGWSIIKVCETSYLWLGAMFIPSKAPSCKYHIAPTAFEEVTPENDVKATAWRKIWVSILKLDESTRIGNALDLSNRTDNSKPSRRGGWGLRARLKTCGVERQARGIAFELSCSSIDIVCFLRVHISSGSLIF